MTVLHNILARKHVSKYEIQSDDIPIHKQHVNKPEETNDM